MSVEARQSLKEPRQTSSSKVLQVGLIPYIGTQYSFNGGQTIIEGDQTNIKQQGTAGRFNTIHKALRTMSVETRKSLKEPRPTSSSKVLQVGLIPYIRYSEQCQWRPDNQ